MALASSSLRVYSIFLLEANISRPQAMPKEMSAGRKSVSHWRKCPLLLSAAELRRRKIQKLPYIIRGFEVFRDTFRMTGIAKRSPLPGKPLRRGECSPPAGQGLEKDLSHCGKRHGCRVVGDVDGFGHKAVEGVFDAERVAFEVGKAELVTVFGNIDPVHFGSVHLARNACECESQYRAFLLDLDVLRGDPKTIL